MKRLAFALLLLSPVLTRAADNEVDFLAMGDWGRGNATQKTVSSTMSHYVTSLNHPVSACLLAGDNFYVPLASRNDPNFKHVFEDIYDPKTLPFPFYAAFGNHDYVNPKDIPADKHAMEMAYAQDHPDSRWKLPSLWYRVDFPVDHPLVSVLMLNSNQPYLSPAQWQEQLTFIEHELSDRHGSTWMIACAHHPLYSNGSHGDNGVLQLSWGALFQKHHLDFYLAGHDHDLQHLEVPGLSTTFILAGGGGASTRPMLRDQRGPFSHSAPGFTHLKLTPTLATITYISGLDGTTFHQFTRTPAGELHTTQTGPIDPATTKPLQSIQGIDSAKKKKKDDD